MKTPLPLLALLLLRPCVAQQVQTIQTPAPQSDQSQAHESVMKSLRGIRMAPLPEGKKLLGETQWILGRADRGKNYHSRPDHTEVTSIYAGLFDKDVPSVKGYNELFEMKAATKSGTTQHLKYLAISFKDTTSDKWKVLSTFDNANDDSGSNLDIDQQIEYFKKRLPDTSVT